MTPLAIAGLADAAYALVTLFLLPIFAGIAFLAFYGANKRSPAAVILALILNTLLGGMILRICLHTKDPESDDIRCFWLWGLLWLVFSALNMRSLYHVFSKEPAWPFDQPRNCAVFTHRQVIAKQEPILLVSHDAEDHGWQFLGVTEANMNDAVLVSLGEIVRHDPSVLALADLPPGWRASRESAAHPWSRQKSPA